MVAISVLDNRSARHLFLQKHGLADAPVGSGKGEDLLALIEQLGFVQIDSIATVERAHHMILHARRQRYRPKNLAPLLEKERSLFEHWTHDASIIPTSFFPHWRLRFDRSAGKLRDSWKSGRRSGFDRQIEPVLTQIRNDGPVCSADVGEGEKRGSGGWWDWHPSKTALEFLWHAGQISVTRRESFRKVYDLTERVIPAEHLKTEPEPQETIDWACQAALDRLGFATSGEIASFWAKVTPAEARDWCVRKFASGEIVEIDVANTDGTIRRCFAKPEIVEDANCAPAPPQSVRILSPFDPVLRDRARAERLFGFDYRIEIFVPAAKRKYGYYVFPALEGDRLIGRLDMKCHRQKDLLHVTKFWPEAKVQLGKGRIARIESAINRTRQFAGIRNVTYEPDWLGNHLQ